MKSCEGTGTLPHDKIKYSSEWCPLCKTLLLVLNFSRKLEIMERCAKGEVVKPSRRIFESERHASTFCNGNAEEIRQSWERH
jgi:hypothetical protein